MFYRYLLCRKLVQIQPIRVWYWRRHRLSASQGQVLLRVPSSTHPLPSGLGKVFSTIFRHEDGPRTSRYLFFDVTRCHLRFMFRSSCYLNTTEQVTRGHNIVVDGWAGAANPHQHPSQPPFQHRHIQKASKTLVFPLFDLCSRMDRRTDEQTDGQADGRTDGQSLS